MSSMLYFKMDQGALYKTISSLRQSKDIDWILSLLPKGNFESFADIGCGSGNFMSTIIKKGKVVKLAVGIEKSQSMLCEAKKYLSSIQNINLKFYLADLLSNFPIPETFDLITMMSVLHWLYPNELQVFSWIRKHLNSNGVFCFTTYHPLDCTNGYGGTDHLVLETLQEIKFSKKLPDNFIPMGTCTRPINEIQRFISNYFRIESVESKMAKMTVQTEDEYIRYHIGTFGSYYIQLLPIYLQDEFLKVIGKVAMARMKQYGYVTKMEVRAWLCGPS